jgi:hypothetical protein
MIFGVRIQKRYNPINASADNNQVVISSPVAGDVVINQNGDEADEDNAVNATAAEQGMASKTGRCGAA